MKINCYSIVIPLYNESEILFSLITELRNELNNEIKNYEILLIDDGSQDNTWQLIQMLSQKYHCVRGYKLSRNYGHQAAIYAGLKLANGQAIGIMDGDGQDPPSVLIKMFHLLEEGYDVVYGIRQKRKENFLKRSSYFIFYRVFRKITNFNFPLDSGDFSAMNKKVRDFIVAIDDTTPFIRAYRSWYGGKQKAIKYDRKAREKGQSKYSWFKLTELALNGVTSFSKFPLRFSSLLGGIIAFFSFNYSLFVIIRKIFFNFPPDGFVTGWASLITLQAFLGGLIIFSLGIIGEYLSQIYSSTKKLPIYLIQESTLQSSYSDTKQGENIDYGNRTTF